MGTPLLAARGGHPAFLDLPWDRPLADWDHPRRLDLPKGISRHEAVACTDSGTTATCCRSKPGGNIPNEEAFAPWVAAGQPGHPLG